MRVVAGRVADRGFREGIDQEFEERLYVDKPWGR